MAQPKLIAVVLLALFAVAQAKPAAQSDRYWPAISEELKKAMNETLSEEDRADAEKTFSFAKEFIGKLEGSEKQLGDELLTAWDQILHHPDSCNEQSLGYIDMIYLRCSTYNVNLTSTMLEPTKKYASECLTPDYIANIIKLRAGRCFEIDLDFVDDQFIADYFSTDPVDAKVIYANLKGLPGPIVNAVNRGREKGIRAPITEAQVRAYLNERLYEPCIEYEAVTSDVMWQMWHVSYFLGYSYGELYKRLDKETQRVFFRFELCKNINLFKSARWAQIEKPVSRRLTGLAAVGQAVAAWKSRTFDS